MTPHRAFEFDCNHGFRDLYSNSILILKFLDFFEEHVKNRSPIPDNPDSVSGLAFIDLFILDISAKLLEIMEATAFLPNFSKI